MLARAPEFAPRLFTVPPDARLDAERMDAFLQKKPSEIETLRARVSELEAALAAITKQRDALLAAASQPVSAAASAVPTPAAPSVAVPAASAVGTGPGEVLAEPLVDTSFLTPRGKFKLRFCENATVLVGKSTEVVVPHDAVSRAWLVPEASGGELLILSLSQPIANGKSFIHHVMVHSKASDASLAISLRGQSLEGQATALLRDALGALKPGKTFTVAGLGGFRPAHGKGALACYNKASEASAYFLDSELLVREGGKLITMPYAGMRAEVLPPSGRRTFDVQLECPPPGGAQAAAGAPPPKPIKLELSLIAADEFGGVSAWLKKKRVNVNGSRDGMEEGDGVEGEATGSKSGGNGGPSNAAADDGDDDDSDDDEDDDDSDDEDDDDFAPSEGSVPNEEFDSEDGEEIAMDDARSGDDAGSGDDHDDDDDDEGDEGNDEREAELMADTAGGGSPAAKRAKTSDAPENVENVKNPQL